MNDNRHRHISPNHPSLRKRVASAAASGRTLHLIDVDNLLGDPTTTDRGRIDLLFGDYRRVAGYQAGDHAVVATGCNSAHVFAVELAWPTACHRRRSGADGADMALLEDAEWAAASHRFERVVLGSGDRIFLVALDGLRAADVRVDVVSRARSLARALAVGAADSVRFLPEADPVLV